MTNADSGELKARVVPISKLQDTTIKRMFTLMRSHYENVSEADFRRDLSKKNDVILLFDGASKDIKGFSTLVHQRLDLGDRPCIGVFSGDTIVEPQYWGQRALQRRFARYIFTMKLKNPTTPVFWFLISKGYKTYLLLSNNFFVHYPRHEKPTPPDVQATMDAFYSSMFPNNYDRSSGLIRFGPEACRLRAGVAEITPELEKKSKRIAYFGKLNPEWKSGVELACVGEINFYTPFLYILKTYLRAPCRAAIRFVEGLWVPKRS